jgi:wyosine [tRNA(Phe)-imidazoG37] synthetase (radical SAM superfamily)
MLSTKALQEKIVDQERKDVFFTRVPLIEILKTKIGHYTKGLFNTTKIAGLMMQPEFNNHCNFRCKFCPHSIYGKKSEYGNKFDREKGFMSDELFNIFLENAKRYASSVVIGFFGEPMLHPKFEEFIKAFPKKRSYQLILNTNWSLATKKSMETLMLFDEVRISIDASRSKLYETLCPGGPVLDMKGREGVDRYETLVRKIEYWLNLERHPRTKLIYVVSSLNENDKEIFLKEWLSKVRPEDSIATKRVLSYGGHMKDAYMRSYPCNIPNERRVTVAWNGDCSPCNLDVNMSLKIGNLAEIKDIKALLEGCEYKKVIENIKRKKGICEYCFDANNHIDNIVHTGKRE